ncbi:hypothetical protein GCM10009623_21240 [Nocardioides aestuarii]|uniref:DUF4241 domain-containing protein n=1 Tax=Nocardioides aestuarii TaxID=252231 RepID=A0ABW4TP59_9ACTN
MAGDDEAVARVRAFIEDWYAAWRQVRPTVTSLYDLNGMTAAGRQMTPLLNEVAARHAVRRLAIGQGGFSLPHATHDPALEDVTASAVEGGRGRVVTTVTRDGGSFHHVYDLAQVDGSWRITAVESALEVPDLSAPEPAPEPGLAPPDPGVELAVDRLFEQGREVTLDGHRSTIGVVTPPPWTTGGAMAVWDLGWGGRGLSPLTPAGPAGTHRVEVSQAFGRNVAVRVVFRDAPVATWHPAATVGVDTGTAALLDVDAVTALDEDRVDALFTGVVESGASRPLVVPLDLGSEAGDGLLVDSGWGDGGYPVSWGADAAGEVVALLVDFLVLAESIQAEVRVPFATGPVEDPALAAAGMAYRVEHGARGWRFVGSNTDGLRMRIVGPDGEVVLDGDRLGVLHQGETWTQDWDSARGVPAGSSLELRLSTGYRHL